MRYRIIAAVFVFLLSVLAGPAFAKQQNRPWQTGRLVDFKQTTCGLFARCLDLSIETTDYYYLCQWNRGRTGRWFKAPDFRSAASVEFSVKTHQLYLKAPNGKEYKTQLLAKKVKFERVLPRPQPTA
jgi:hypothetical protein